MLAQVLQAELNKRGWSTRDLGKLLGVSHTTIIRILKGGTIEIDTMKKVCDWLHISVGDAVSAAAGEGKTALASKVAILIEREPKLARVFEDAIGDFEGGKLSLEELDDIIAYASYRLGRSIERTDAKIQGEDR
jgi:transcriptional regulator with XRE-family HTH domain